MIKLVTSMVMHRAVTTRRTSVVKERVGTVKYVVTRGANRSSERVQQEMEEMFRSLLPARRAVDPHRNGLWRPAIEVYETTDALVINIEVAGLDRDEVRIDLDGDRLSVRGIRHDRTQAEKRSYHEARIPYGAFGADVFIPFPINADSVTADYTDGFLRIVLPRLKARAIFPRDGGAGDEEGANT